MTKTATQSMLDRQFKIEEQYAAISADDADKTSFRTKAVLSSENPEASACWKTLVLAVSTGIFGSAKKAMLDTALETKVVLQLRLRISGITVVDYLLGTSTKTVSPLRPAVQYFTREDVDDLDDARRTYVQGLAEKAMAGNAFDAQGGITGRTGVATVLEGPDSTSMMDIYPLGIEDGRSRYQDMNEGLLFFETPKATDGINTAKKDWWMLVTVTIPINQASYVSNVQKEIVVEGDVIVLSQASE